MPMTEFARMRRSDHSMRPPAPALTLAFDSPNACNLCHADEDAELGGRTRAAWRERDYQAPMLARAAEIAAARAGDWTGLEEMLAPSSRSGRDEVHATSLIRLLARNPDPKQVPVFLAALEDPSPLVRSAAATGLRPHLSPEVLRALVPLLEDEVRLVRIRAAGALAGIPPGPLPERERAALTRAMAELETSLAGRPDAWSSHYNLGNLREQQGDREGALAAYRRATALRADVIQPRVNAALVLARLQRPKEAEQELRAALEIDRDSAAAHYNLGLLLAEFERLEEARTHLEAAFQADSSLAAAAYNLAVLVAKDDFAAAATWSAKALALRPDLPRYVHTHAYFLRERGLVDEAVSVLEQALMSGVVAPEIVQLLGETYVGQGRGERARELYMRASADPRLPREARGLFARMAAPR